MAGASTQILSDRFLTPTELVLRLKDLDEAYQDDPETKKHMMLEEFFEILTAHGYASAIAVFKMAKKF